MKNFLTIQQFKTKYGLSLTLQGMRYQCRKGLIDCIRPGHEWLIEETERTLKYYKIDIDG